MLLTDAVAKGARCLDGTPVRYWVSSNPGSKSKRFVIDLMGGGWCESLADCATRAYGPRCWLGSSNPECLAAESPAGNGMPGVVFNETMDLADIPSCLGSRWCGGLMDSDPAVNPTANYTRVLVPYCDGGSYAGGNFTSTLVTLANGTVAPLYFRGRLNLHAILDDLIVNHGLGDAEELVLTGNSAGGLAVYWHVDDIAARLPRTTVIGAPDSGYFMTAPEFPSWPAFLKWGVQQFNASGGLNQACVAGVRAGGGDPATCTFPEVVSPYIASPLFVMQSRFDPALDSITAGEKGTNVSHVNAIGARLLGTINATVLAGNPRNGAFITSCHEHCGQWGTGWIEGPGGSFDDFNVTIAGDNALSAYSEWYAGPRVGRQGGRLWVQSASYPCATCCAGGDA